MCEIKKLGATKRLAVTAGALVITTTLLNDCTSQGTSLSKKVSPDPYGKWLVRITKFLPLTNDE